jgi:hypothetical protein
MCVSITSINILYSKNHLIQTQKMDDVNNFIVLYTYIDRNKLTGIL